MGTKKEITTHFSRCPIISRNYWANISGSKVRPDRKADNMTATYEPIIDEMWKPLRLTAQ
jgi:hypothetical protein